jgi:exonuclease SbcC
MRLRKLALKGITRFDQAEIDFAALGEGLIAIAGANGAGKTSILEAPFAALYGEFPTRPGSLYGVAHGKDARLELEVDNGQPYRVLVAVDAEHQRSEAYLYNGDGTPLTSGKVRDYAAEVERRFGSARLMLSAALSCQSKRGSFLDLSKADRKDLLAEILDTGGLQRLAEAARAKAKAGELALERLRGQLAEAEAELQRLAGAGSTEDLRVQRARIQAELATAQADLEVARTRYADLQTRHALAVEAEKRREAKAKDIVRLHAEVAALKAKTEGVPTEVTRARERAKAAIANAEEEALYLPKYRSAAAAMPKARERRVTAQTDLTTAEQALRQVREDLLAKTKETGKAAGIRVKLAAAQRQAGLLGEVPCTSSEAWQGYDPGDAHAQPAIGLSATCPLLADARAAKEAIAALEAELADVEALEADLHGYQQAVDEADAAVRGARQSLAEAQAEVERLEPLAARVAGAQAAQTRAGELREQLEETLASLAAREAEYREQLEALTAKRTALVVELETMQAANAAAIKAELDACGADGHRLKGAVDQSQAELGKLVQAITLAEAEAQRRSELEQRAAGARQQAASLEFDLGDWVTLERALGRDGIQALLIDAAGPELSSLTNELLTSCFGPRFEVKFVTQALKADGKSQKEVFDVQVVDHDHGREGAVDSLSGGEKTIVSEAISLALAIYVGRHSGRRYETLFRDETAGQLDPDNAQRYVAMLRRARVMAGAHQVVFIAQQPEVWQQADAVLYLQDGKIEVRP